MIKWMTIAFGSVPILGWLASMPWNWLTFGTPCTACGEWNNYPLWLVTSPFLQMGEAIGSGHPFPSVLEHPYAGVVLYTLVCTLLYALVGVVLGLLMRGCVGAWTRRKKSV